MAGPLTRGRRQRWGGRCSEEKVGSEKSQEKKEQLWKKTCREALRVPGANPMLSPRFRKPRGPGPGQARPANITAK